MIRTYPTNHPGAFSLECSTAGHGRCRSVACECACHHRTVDDAVEAYERKQTGGEVMK